MAQVGVRRRVAVELLSASACTAIAFAALPGFGQHAPAVPNAVAAATTSTVGAVQPIAAEQFGPAVAGAGLIEGSTKRRILHFTFDDGPEPDPQLTPRLLAALDRIHAKATFFFSTSRFASREKRNARAAEIAREVARRGHQLGEHGFDHVRMSRLKAPQLEFQVSHAADAFQGVFGQRTFLFRPPFGSRNPTLDAMLADGRFATVLWNIGMADWVQRTPEAIEQTFWRVLARNEAEHGDRGGVVLLHDTHPWSVIAFELISGALERRNCELLAKGEELFDIVDSLAPWATPFTDEVYGARQAALKERTRARCDAGRSPSAP
jgi:peptidoglycan/xylan/chitin deacetylase (PgdA/CDA1 family)